MVDKKIGGAGLRGQSAGETALCTVGKTGAGLTYRGYDMKELAEKLGITTGTLTVQVDKLVNANLKQLKDHQNGETDYDLNITDVDIDNTELEDLLVGGKTKVLIQDIDNCLCTLLKSM